MSDVPALVAEVRSTFKSGRTRSLAWRVQQLNACKAMLNDNADRWCAAVEADTLKPHTDALIGDICVAQAELDSIMSNLKAWMTPQDAGTPLTLIPATSRVEKQPHGCTLVIGPCNYPLQLTLCPMYGAIAAGNTVVLKPSEQCPQVAELLASFVKAYLDPDAVKVVLGGVEATSALLDQKWDHIIFTGSTRVGKIVAAAAAKHLTPTTLELGGKCPVIIDGNTSEPIESIADKIFFGRFFSGGQSCVAPEYVLVPRDLVSGFTSAFVRMIGERFGERPDESDSLGKLASSAAAQRIGKLLTGHGGKNLCGGTFDAARRYVAPTVVLDPKRDAPILHEEVFGPVLCVLPVDSLEEAIDYASSRPGTPLAMYVFTSSSDVERRVLDAVPSGTAMVNDVCVHFANGCLPFGGLGDSGHGALHGIHYFDSCSQTRGVMTKGTSTISRLLDLQVTLRRAPYKSFNTKLAQIMLTKVAINCPPKYITKVAVIAMLAIGWWLLTLSGMHLKALRAVCTGVLDWLGPEP